MVTFLIVVVLQAVSSILYLTLMAIFRNNEDDRTYNILAMVYWTITLIN